jgi:hypothetical protein
MLKHNEAQLNNMLKILQLVVLQDSADVALHWEAVQAHHVWRLPSLLGVQARRTCMRSTQQ